MNRRSMALLERAFVAEVEAAVSEGIGLIQTKSKLAEQLSEQVYLMKCKRTVGDRFPIVVTGYELTHLGRMTYCASVGKQV